MKTPPPLPTKNVAGRNGCGVLLLIVLGLVILSVASSFLVGPPTEKQQLTDGTPPEKALASRSVLPGLSPVDIYLNLEKKGFKTRRQFGSEQNEFICELKEPFASYSVTIFTPPGQPSAVSAVSITATNTGDPTGDSEKERKAFLGYIATTPYSGSMPEAAQQWVAAKYQTKAEKTFGAVRFQLAATDRATVLRLSPTPPTTP